jgi:hypothetical protein
MFILQMAGMINGDGHYVIGILVGTIGCIGILLKFDKEIELVLSNPPSLGNNNLHNQPSSGQKGQKGQKGCE